MQNNHFAHFNKLPIVHRSFCSVHFSANHLTIFNVMLSPPAYLRTTFRTQHIPKPSRLPQHTLATAQSLDSGPACACRTLPASQVARLPRSATERAGVSPVRRNPSLSGRGSRLSRVGIRGSAGRRRRCQTRREQIRNSTAPALANRSRLHDFRSLHFFLVDSGFRFLVEFHFEILFFPFRVFRAEISSENLKSAVVAIVAVVAYSHTPYILAHSYHPLFILLFQIYGDRENTTTGTITTTDHYVVAVVAICWPKTMSLLLFCCHKFRL